MNLRVVPLLVGALSAMQPAAIVAESVPIVTMQKPGALHAPDASDCPSGTTTKMPIIAWGADGVTLDANGMSLKPGGDLANAGWNLSLEVEDDFGRQLANYMRCDSPFLRGTGGMLAAVTGATESDPRTEQVVIFQHSFSIGDGIVAGPGIKKIADLKGKRIAVQKLGPHVDFVGRILKDAGLSFDDVELVWTQGLTGDGDTPAASLREGTVEAAAVILPDADILTSGSVGTGAEGSVKGAEILISTREAASVISDYISVRRDFFEAHKEEIQGLVHTLMLREEAVRAYMADEGSPQREQLAMLMGDYLLGGLGAEDGQLLWADAVTSGWSGNARHFSDPNELRSYDVIMAEAVGYLRSAGMIATPIIPATAEWDYLALADGIQNLSARQIAAFDQAKVAEAVTTLRRTGQLDDATKLEFTIYFEPDSTTFPMELYEDDFRKILDLTSTYSGSVISIEGHSDPLLFLRKEKEGAPMTELKGIRTATRNLSLERAAKALDALEDFAGFEGAAFQREKFTVDGLGIAQPRYSPPTSKEEWRANMRVIVKILAVQAEATEFVPL